MSLSNYLVILTETKDVWSISQSIQETIKNLVLQARVDNSWRDPNNKLPEFHLEPLPQMMLISFMLKVNSRCLTVHFGCDCDFESEGLAGSKLIFSLDLSNVSDEVLDALALNPYLRSLGDVYRFSDATREDLLSCKV